MKEPSPLFFYTLLFLAASVVAVYLIVAATHAARGLM